MLGNFKQIRVESKKHLDFVGTLGCLACPSPLSVAHHVTKKMMSSMGKKPDDSRVMNLCNRCHIEECHKKGEDRFYTKLGGREKIDRYMEELFKHTGNQDRCLELMRRFRE